MTGYESALHDVRGWRALFLVRQVAHGHGLRLVSFDRGFKRFAEIEVAVLGEKK